MKTSTRQAPWSTLAAIAGLSALWLLLTEADAGALVVGVPCVVLAVSALHWQRAGASMPQVLPALALLPGFMVQSIQGALDIGARTFGLLPLPTPCTVRWPLALPHGRGRLLFMNMVSLIPGTLSMRDEPDCVMVHVLDGASDPAPSLTDLERRVARVYGIEGADRG